MISPYPYQDSREYQDQTLRNGDLDLRSGVEVTEIPARPIFTEQLQTYVEPELKQTVRDLAKSKRMTEAAVIRWLLSVALSDHK